MMKSRLEPIQEKKSQALAEAAGGKSRPAFQFKDNRTETKQLQAVQSMMAGTAPVQRMHIGEQKFSILRDLNATYKEDAATKARIDAMVNHANADVFAELKKVIKSTEVFADFDAFEAKVMGAFTDDPDKAEMPASAGPQGQAGNAKGGPVSGLARGKGAGWLAGSGPNWHVHYDHAKCGNGPRINFDGRPKATILSAMDEAYSAGGALSGQRLVDWNATRAWVDSNK